MKKKEVEEIVRKMLGMKGGNPDFIDVDKIKEGMKLKSWFESDYQPTNGKFRQRDGFYYIRRVDFGIIFYSYGQDDGSINSEIKLCTKENFYNHTLLV